MTTDFGLRDWYVGCMKGVILQINPNANIVDVSHLCSSQDVLKGSFILAHADYFPEGTIHIAIIDPGVGSDREAVIVKLSNNQFYVCPNNGLLSFLLQKYSVVEAFVIENPNYIRSTVSNTFHGRDVFAPAAAHLSLGESLSNFGRPVNEIKQLSIAQPKISEAVIQGEIIYIDKFGNLISNIHKSMLQSKIISGAVANHTINNIGCKYSDVDPGASLILFSSEDYIEVSINQGNAQMTFSAFISSPITLNLSKS